MTQPTIGWAADIASNLPTAKTVSAATNATPIVVTTTTAHGLQTGEVFTISGVTGNTAANGTFIAGTVTSNTVALTAYPGGASVAGSGAYTGSGTLQSLGFGLPVPIPSDLTDAMRAGGIGVPFEALLDMAAYLMYRAGPNGSINAQLAAFESLFYDVPTIIAGTTATIAVTPNAPVTKFTIKPATAGGTISLQTTTLPAPAVGQKIVVFVPAVPGIPLAGNVFFKREGSVANLGELLGGTNQLTFLEFCFTSGDGWIISNAAAASADWSPGLDTHIYGY